MTRRPSYIFALAFAGAMASIPALGADGGAMQAPHGPHGPHGEPDRGPGLERGMPPGVVLDDAQEQKAFAIRHAAEPLMFEQMTALRKAHDTLRQLGESVQFDEAKAAAAASAIGNASAAMALSRARVASQMTALLTPEQRAQLAQRHPVPRR